MKAKRRQRLIAEAVEAGREFGKNQRPPLSYKTIDLFTGDDEFPQVISIPYDPWHWELTGHIKIDLPKMGYRLTKVES